MSTVVSAPVEAGTDPRPACESCGSHNTLRYMPALRGTQFIDLCVCLDCRHLFSALAQDETPSLTQAEELASFETVASARAQAAVACPICGCHCAGKR